MEDCDGTGPSAKPIDIVRHLPLCLAKSEIIPPAPNRSKSSSEFEPAIDWLSDFAGYSWIAYGASSLLVIKHFPNPLSERETAIGSILHQVFELSVDGTGTVSAVAWSPATPSSGGLAASLDTCIGLFSFQPEICDSSFCWSQTTVLVQSTKVDAIKWTGSGDGIVSVGIEVVLWKKYERSWEIAWKFRPEVPQMIVSATWSIEGPLATAPLHGLQVEDLGFPTCLDKNYVLVFRGDKDSQLAHAMLPHPQPVSMVQWRPSASREPNKDGRSFKRLLLLTCCLDGAVRLWSEMNDEMVKKPFKENDRKVTRLCLQVVAVAEMNQPLSGKLGYDIFVRWATDIDGVVKIGEETCLHSSLEEDQHDKFGKCEWLIAYGPEKNLSLWAAHCLDDFAPARFPRITLWNNKEINFPEVCSKGLPLSNVFITRNQFFEPPIVCSWVDLLPCNTLVWIHLYSSTPTPGEERSSKSSIEEDGLPKKSQTDILPFCARGILDVDNYSDKISQVAVLPCSFESEFAASLSINGVLQFWTLSATSCDVMPTLNSSWKFSGITIVSRSSSRYSCLNWGPAMSNEEWSLFVGHAHGVDFFIVTTSKNEEKKLLCHNMCTIPFFREDNVEGPNSVCLISLPSTDNETFVYNNFLLVSVWKSAFQALSSKISIHYYDDSGISCNCNLGKLNNVKNSSCRFKSSFCSKTYCVSVEPCSSRVPAPYNHDLVSSFEVLCPTNYVLSMDQDSSYEKCSNHFSYHLVTGCSDGSLKIWKSKLAKSLNSQWELVGLLCIHSGPILAISSSSCGRRIATISKIDKATTSSNLHIWECVHLMDQGSFILEDTLYFDSEVVALNWLTMGNGQLLLGVCTGNKLQVYGQRRCGGHYIMKSETSLEGRIWVCIAECHTKATIHDFFWGPKATIVVAHSEYFSLYSRLLFLEGSKSFSKFCEKMYGDRCVCCNGSEEPAPSSLYEGFDNHRRCQFRSPMKMNTILEIIPVINVKVSEKECNSLTNIGIWSMLELMEMLGGSIPVIHPDALLVNLLSGHWKRSHVVLNCFSEHISCETFAKRSCFQNFRCYTLPVPLSNYLEGCTLRSSADKSFQWSGGMSSSLRESYQSASNLGNYEPLTSPSRCEISSFIEAFDKLSKCTIMSDTEVMYTRAAITLLQEVSNTELVSPYESLDDPGRRFWVAMRFQLLYFVERCHRSPLVGELVAQSSLIGWAFHSGCQDTLFDSLLSTEPSWEEMRDIGIGFWFTNVTQLRSKMEKLAKQQYLKNKDPKACTLLYIALNKIQVLRGLFRISKDEKDKPLVGFLSRNFQEDKNKAAAVKNAYVLLGKHELELAVAFFLLGGDMTSAVTVCVKNLRDEQLGLLICHLVEGYGGPLEHYIVMKLLLPSAVAKGDYWLASFLEWILGNYSRSYQRMLAVPPESCLHKYVLSSHQDAFLDPSIGQYCLMLTMKTCMRNVVGEKNAAALGKWANLMCATALSRCGLPLEALECLCSSLNIFASSDLGSIARNADTEIFNVGTLEVLVNKSMSNWITGGVAFDVASNARIDLAMQYITKLLRKHPCWIDIDKRHIQAYTYTEPEYEARKRLLNMFQDELLETVLCLEQKFSVTSIDLMNMIFLSLSNKNLECIGYSLLYDYTSKYTLEEKGRFNIFFSYPLVPKRLLKVAEDVLHSLSRYVIVCGMSYFNPELSSGRGNAATTHGIGFIQPLELYKWSFICSLCCVREMMMLYSISSNHIFTRNHFIVLNLFEIFLYFSTFWAQRNLRGLTMILTPLVAACDEGIASHEINIEDLWGILFQNSESMIHDTPGIGVASLHINDEKLHKQVGDLLSSVSKEKVWQTIGLFLWGTVSIILEYQVCIMPLEPRGRKFEPQDTTQKPSSSSVHDGNSPVEMVSVLARLLKETCGHVSDYCVKQLASFMLERVSKSAYLCPEYRSPTKILDHFIENVNILSDGDELSSSKMFRSICTELWEVKGDFLQEKTQLLQYIKYKSLSGWHNVYPDIMGACEAEETCDKDVKLDSPSSAAGSPLACLSPNDHPFLNSSGKYSDLQENILPFDKPKEIYRRNGELLEALCFNSVDRCQGALSSNRKGILFFNWKDGLSCAHRSDFVWEKADWPCNGCTRYEATAISLHVSPEVVLSKKMTSPELGGATVSVGSSLRPMKVFTSRGTFGVPGYAGITSGLGWGVQQDIDECVFPPVTVENVRSRAFSTHPSRPFFLVGSSSEHIHLWEYGKDRASATYGVVPATNVPRSYALAYISSVQFDYYGHRFVTAASDGTVSTWQLEVGGKSNIHPTESSICFKNYTSDATYITTSGSIIAAAGYSSNGVNVVIWDTLAPPTTSQASIMCHEGGASSLSVFDNDIGSGSISPLIVTGGKGGDVGIHDFRYIATGRAAKKNNKHFDMSQQSVHSTVDMHYRTGDQNRNGMLWYIPKAHTASVTKICTIPNTSFFLTGSKDGDVKLWDAKRARLVFHWPKLHERHTFLQPTSHGFGGVRAGVTNMQIVSTGFVSCGGDGSVRLVSVKGGVKHAHTNNLYSTS